MRALGVLMVLALGCVSGTDQATGELSPFDPADYADEVVYLHPDLAAPLRADELGPDVADAIPVGIRVHAHFAVAWHAPLGVPRVGDESSVIRAWRLYDGEANPLIGGIVEPGDGETEVTPPAVTLPEVDIDQDLGEPFDREYFWEAPPQLNIIWLEEWRDAWVRFWTYHPECA